MRHIPHRFQARIDHDDAAVRLEDQQAIVGAVENGLQLIAAFGDLAEQAGVGNGDGGLIGQRRDELHIAFVELLPS